MPPGDIPTRAIPEVFRHLLDEGIPLGPMQLGPLLDRIPLTERAILMLGSAEGLDSASWSVERDAALAELAARRLPADAFAENPALALDLSIARRTAVDGRLAYHVHRNLRPAAEGVRRLLGEAHRRGVLGAQEILAEAMALTTLAPSGLPPNEVHAETRGSPRNHVGNEPHRIWPDVAVIIAGTSDDMRRGEIHLAIERTIALFQRSSAVEVLEEAFARCLQLLPPEGEVAVLLVALPKAYWATSGSRCQLLRARRGELAWLSQRTEGQTGAPAFGVHTFDAQEGDTFLLLDDEAWAGAVSKASARPPEPRPVATTLREEMRRRFVERMSGAAAGPVDLSPRSLLTAKLGELANAAFSELGAEREATLAILRVPPWSPPADLSARLTRELRAFSEEEGVALELRSARVELSGDGFPPPGRTRHLALVLGCDSRLEREDAEALADAFATELLQRHPPLFCSHHVEVEPIELVADPSLSDRLDAVDALIDDVLRARVGLVARVKATPSWGARTHIEVVILRDDVDGADDEHAAATTLRGAMEEADPALSEAVDIRAEYIK